MTYQFYIYVELICALHVRSHMQDIEVDDKPRRVEHSVLTANCAAVLNYDQESCDVF